jgi:hypothetical protein
MPSPFPGMDPYLEDRLIWTGFHHGLAEEIRSEMNTRIGPKYYADVEVYTPLPVEEVHVSLPRMAYPDVAVIASPTRGPIAPVLEIEPVTAPAPMRRRAISGEIRLRSVRIFLTQTDELITSIELISPYNKRGDGLLDYRRKRTTLLASAVHLVEVDLLRAGERAGLELVEPPLDETDYVLLVNRGGEPHLARLSEIWPAPLNEPLPLIPIPLQAPDRDVALDLNACIAAIYQRAGYDWRIDYTQPVPQPPLRPAMAEWWREKQLSVTSDQ